MTDPSAPARPDNGSGDDDWAERQARHLLLKIVVIVLGGVFAVLALVVLSTLTLRFVKSDGDAASAGLAPAAILLPAGARVTGTSAGEGRLLIAYEADGRNAVLILDAATLAPIGRIEAPPSP